MKKLILVLCLLLTLTLLVACGGETEKESNDQNTTPEEDNNSQGEENTDPDGSKEDEGSDVVDMNVAAKELGVPFGFYNITNKKGNVLSSPITVGQPIAFDLGAQKNLSEEEASTWTLEPKIASDGSLVYVLFCTYDPHHAAKPANLIPGKGLIRAAYEEDKNEPSQQWVLKKNEDGTFRLHNKKNPIIF